MTRLIAKLLVLVAVLAMPFSMAPALAHQQHAMTGAMPMQHCPDQSPLSDSKGGIAICSMACATALPAAGLFQEEHLLIASAPTAPLAAQILRGLHPDTATPPPKCA